MAKNITEVTDASFQNDVLKSDKPTLVDFWAPWCGPCLSIAPTIEAIATEQAATLKVCKVNVDENPETAAAYGIRGIPTLIIFNHGKVANQLTGAVGKKNIEDLIKSA